MHQEDPLAMAYTPILDPPPMATSASDLSSSRYHQMMNPEKVAFRERAGRQSGLQRQVGLDREKLSLKLSELDLEINAIEIHALSSTTASDPSEPGLIDGYESIDEFLDGVFGDFEETAFVGQPFVATSNKHDGTGTAIADQPFFAASSNTVIVSQAFVTASNSHDGNGTAMAGQPFVASANSNKRDGNGNCHVRPNDVLLGRGRKHPGNDHFRKVVAAWFDTYESSKKHEQTKIAREVVRTITNDGGRFLVKAKKSPTNSDEWVQIDFSEARLKVAHTFRTIRKARRKKASM